MNSFSRIIARPTTSIWEDAPPQAARGQMDALRVIWERLPNVVVYGPGSYRPAYVAHWPRLSRRAYAEDLPTYAPLPDRENDPVVSATPSPRRRNDFARTDSMGSIPSLCSDDLALDSPLSCSPVLSSPGSPPPTACSAVAVLGSPGYMGGFADEHDHSRAHPDFVRMQLEWREHVARMADGAYSSTDDSVKSDNGPPTPGKVPPVQPAASQILAAATRVLDANTRAASKTSRLSQRVRAPPALNTSALRAETLLSKLLRGSYDVEVGHTDGSALSDAESGFEGDDEGEEHLFGKDRCGYALCEAGVDRKQPGSSTKKTYAAVAAIAPRVDCAAVCGDAVTEAHAAFDGGVQGTKDWTSMFERQGPFVEVVDA
ncbi:hypothetical protein TRAPUB_12838 [Trametes pubescens]|uniref:Uncharacterized protein n=1 Tax=Trametes pubescens TaxID=154538 RepID=A0A1M2VSR2_TRAPU|nr:hypothetical protein TRAPUB_12838 [Trametes pubescens]